MAVSGSNKRAAGGQRLDAPLNSVTRVREALENACAPVIPSNLSLAEAAGAIAALDVAASGPMPLGDVALMDGRAVASSDLIGASPMSPVFATGEPPFVRVGEHIPPGCDCVIDDALVCGGGLFEIHGAAAPGDGVRRAGEDARPGETILRAGAKIGGMALLALQAAGVTSITARRPRVRVVATPDESGETPTAKFIATLVGEGGASVELVCIKDRNAPTICSTLDADACDAMFVIGGSGLGGDDHSVDALRRGGEVMAHGFALDPGRTAAAGRIDSKPVICIPGRFDSALAIYLALGVPLLRHLAGAQMSQAPHHFPLARKVSSAVGLAQIALLQADEAGLTPLAVGDFTLAHLLRADSYIIIPEGSEGLAEGALVRPSPMPGRSIQR